MNHIIIRSKRGIYHRCIINNGYFVEVSLKTGRHTMNGLIFRNIEDLESREFKVVDEIPAKKYLRFGYCGHED